MVVDHFLDMRSVYGEKDQLLCHVGPLLVVVVVCALLEAATTHSASQPVMVLFQPHRETLT